MTAGSGRRPPAPSWLVFRHRKPLPTGAPGLLLVYRCAQNLGWRLETAANQETVLRMTLPPEPLAAFGTHNVLRTPRPESGAARLREEFRATLPPKKI